MTQIRINKDGETDHHGFLSSVVFLPLLSPDIMANEMQMMALQEWAGKRGHEDGREDGGKR